MTEEKCPRCGKSIYQIFATHLIEEVREAELSNEPQPPTARFATTNGFIEFPKRKEKKRGKKAFDKKAYMREYWKKRQEKKKASLPEVLERLEKIDKKRKEIEKKLPKEVKTK